MRKIKLILTVLFVSIIFSCFSLDSISAETTNTNIKQKEYESKNVKDLFKAFINPPGFTNF